MTDINKALKVYKLDRILEAMYQFYLEHGFYRDKEYFDRLVENFKQLTY